MSVNGPKPRACDLNKCNTIAQRQSRCTEGDGVKRNTKCKLYSLSKRHMVFKSLQKKTKKTKQCNPFKTWGFIGILSEFKWSFKAAAERCTWEIHQMKIQSFTERNTDQYSAFFSLYGYIFFSLFSTDSVLTASRHCRELEYDTIKSWMRCFHTSVTACQRSEAFLSAVRHQRGSVQSWKRNSNSEL